MKALSVDLITQDLEKGGVKIPIFLRVRDKDVIPFDTKITNTTNGVLKLTKSNSSVEYIDKVNLSFTKVANVYQATITTEYKMIAAKCKLFVSPVVTDATTYNLYPIARIKDETTIEITLIPLGTPPAENSFRQMIDIHLIGEFTPEPDSRTTVTK